jgi:hypothetical protein
VKEALLWRKDKKSNENCLVLAYFQSSQHGTGRDLGLFRPLFFQLFREDRNWRARMTAHWIQADGSETRTLQPDSDELKSILCSAVQEM